MTLIQRSGCLHHDMVQNDMTMSANYEDMAIDTAVASNYSMWQTIASSSKKKYIEYDFVL